MNETPSSEPAIEVGTPTFRKITPFYKFFRGMLRVAGSVMFDFKTYDIGNVPREGGILIVANHQSFLDPAFLGMLIKRPVSYLAKSELFHNPIFGGTISRLNAFPVKQGDGDIGAVRETIRRLQEGHVLTMFPEGGRCENGTIEKMQSGVGLIVRKAGPGVRIVPAAIRGAFEAWPRTSLLPRSHPVRAKYGKPLMLANLKAAEIVKILDREIRQLFDELEDKF